MMFGFHLNRELMGGGGGSSGGGGGGGSVGSNTPGSPGAADGNRGSSMGAGGGTAGPSGGGSSGGSSNRGGSTNPGRPGGESGERGSAAPGGGGSNSGSPGRDTPGAPDASDGNRGSTMGPDGGIAGSSSSSGGSESIAGSDRARGSFSVNSSSARGMMTFGGARDAGMGPVGGFRGTSSLSGGRDSGISAGLVTDGLDRTTPGYQMVVGDSELSAEEQAKEAAMADRMSVQPATRDRYSAQGLGIIGDNQPEMNTGFLGPVAGGLLAVGQNYLAGRKTANELSGLEQEANLPSSFFGDDPSTYAQAYGSERLANSPLGFLGDEQANEKALAGSYNTNDGTDGLDGRNQGGGPPSQEVTYPPEQQPGGPAGPAPGGRFGGSLGDYGSYARRFFSRT